MKRYFVNLLFIIIGLLVILRGLEFLDLYFYGERAQAYITYTNKAGYGRRGNSYNVHYEFTLPDSSLQTGSAVMSRKGGGEPSGWLHVKYLRFLPDFNRPDSATIILYAAVWCGAGIALIIFNIFRMRNKKKTYDRLERMSGERQHASVASGFISLLLLLGIGIGLVYYFFILPTIPKNEKASEIVSNSYGNTQGNVSNDGIAVCDGKHIYFANFHDSQKLYAMEADGSGIRKISDESVSCINFYDGWIYYCSFENGNDIFRIKPDGNGRRKVYRWKSSDVSISGGWFFLSNGNDHNRIYRVRIDGKNELKLNNDESSNLSVGGGWIYYTNETDWKRLYRIRTNGSQRTALTDFQVVSVVADEKGVFFTSADDGLLYRLENDGTKPVRVTEFKVGMPNVTEGKIYYTDEDRALSTMDLSGNAVKKLGLMNSWFITVLGDNIMTVDFMESDYNYLTNGSTGEAKEIH